MRQTIKDNRGVIIGFLNETAHGDVMVFDTNNNQVGMYRKSANITYNRYNQMVGYGDHSMRLIMGG